MATCDVCPSTTRIRGLPSSYPLPTAYLRKTLMDELEEHRSLHHRRICGGEQIAPRTWARDTVELNVVSFVDEHRWHGSASAVHRGANRGVLQGDGAVLPGWYSVCLPFSAMTSSDLNLRGLAPGGREMKMHQCVNSSMLWPIYC